MDEETNWSLEPKANSLSALLFVIPRWTASFWGGLLLDCKFPDCMAGRGRLWKGQASAPACSGSGKEDSFISWHPEGGSHVHAPWLRVCVYALTHGAHLCVCVTAACAGLYLEVCAALFTDFDGKGQVWHYRNYVRINLIFCAGIILRFRFLSVQNKPLWMFLTHLNPVRWNNE